MPQAFANGIYIEYDTFGNPSYRPLLLIGGLSDQLIYWEDELWKNLAAEGNYIIRFDNRDAGLSTKCEDGHAYTLMDMADDAVGLPRCLKGQQSPYLRRLYGRDDRPDHCH